jgi:hypothetical protein
MPTEVIPKTRWRDFLDSFNRVHRGWLITVDSPTGAGLLMRDVPLASILFEDGDIVIEAAMDRQHVDHVVQDVVALRLERTAAGADRHLEIVRNEGDIVRVRFRSAIRPELVDGIVSV